MKDWFRYGIGYRVPSSAKWWPWSWVGIRLGLGGLLLWWATIGGQSAYIPLLMAAGLIVWVLWVTGRITIHDMMNARWKTRHGGVFVVLNFSSFLGLVVAVAVAFAAVESVTVRWAFDPPLETPGEALIAVLAFFGGDLGRPKSGAAQATSTLGLVVILFMLVVVIAAVVNAYRARPDNDP